jgi:ribosome-binding factor A
MSRRRIQRLNEQLKRELAELIRTGVRDPRVGVVTVTAVDVTSDLSVARVYVRVAGDEAHVGSTLAGLAAAAPFLRGALGKELRVRRIPELRFQIDSSLERALRIEEILADVLPPEVDDQAAEGDEAESGRIAPGRGGSPRGEGPGEKGSDLPDATDGGG